MSVVLHPCSRPQQHCRCWLLHTSHCHAPTALLCCCTPTSGILLAHDAYKRRPRREQQQQRRRRRRQRRAGLAHGGAGLRAHRTSELLSESCHTPIAWSRRRHRGGRRVHAACTLQLRHRVQYSFSWPHLVLQVRGSRERGVAGAPSPRAASGGYAFGGGGYILATTCCFSCAP